MKAIIHDRYGSPDVLELQEATKPVVADDAVLVRIRAASLNPYDWHFLTGLPYVARMSMGLLKPKLNGLGADLSGQVEAVGQRVTEFQPGDDVYGEVASGAFAEYACVSEDALARKPANLTFEEAAAVPMVGFTALQGLRDIAQLQPGQRVLINGAAGGVGTFAVQIAKVIGAHATGVCSTANVDLVGSIGADDVVDYTQEDFARREPRYDVVFDLVGNRSLSECRRVLKPEGAYVSCFGQPEHRWLGPVMVLAKMAALSPFVSHKLATWVVRPSKDDLLHLNELLEGGKVRPIIDRAYPLDKLADAMGYLEQGHARGKVVITV